MCPPALTNCRTPKETDMSHFNESELWIDFCSTRCFPFCQEILARKAINIVNVSLNSHQEPRRHCRNSTITSPEHHRSIIKITPGHRQRTVNTTPAHRQHNPRISRDEHYILPTHCENVGRTRFRIIDECLWHHSDITFASKVFGFACSSRLQNLYCSFFSFLLPMP